MEKQPVLSGEAFMAALRNFAQSDPDETTIKSVIKWMAETAAACDKTKITEEISKRMDSLIDTCSGIEKLLLLLNITGTLFALYLESGKVIISEMFPPGARICKVCNARGDMSYGIEHTSVCAVGKLLEAITAKKEATT